MAGIGRPKGSRKVSPVRQKAMTLFHEWREAGHPGIITRGKAFDLTHGLVGDKDSTEKISLAATALNYSIILDKNSRK